MRRLMILLCGLVLAFVAIFFGASEGWKWATTSRTFALSEVQVSGQDAATDVVRAWLAFQAES